MPEDTGFERGVEQIAALADGVRRRLYRFVVGQGRPVGRDEAAGGVGVPHHTAKFHLDKLVEEGLLEVEFRRLTDRSGPGAGRPAKLYRRAAGEVSVSVPARHYELAGAVLAEAVTVAAHSAVPVGAAVADAARAAGGRLAAGRRAEGGGGAGDAVLVEALAEFGFEPYAEAAVLRLRNCPFHTLAASYPELVCAMNLELLRGLAEGLGAGALRAHLDPGADRCCVALEEEEREPPG